MSLVADGPTSGDPFGQAKEILGISFIDQVLNGLSMDDCLELALKRMSEITEKTREDSIVITKIEEAQLWAMQSHRVKRKSGR